MLRSHDVCRSTKLQKNTDTKVENADTFQRIL
jgi:hypothetical protein